MESCLLDLAKNEVQSLVNLVKKEAQYLCCYNIHVKNFKQKKDILVAKHKDVKRKFQKGKGVLSFKFEAQQWEGEAEGIIHIDTKIKKKLFFGWCLNCWSLHRKGKELAEEAQHIEKLLERCNSNITEGRANVLDIKYLSSHDFLHFKSRESKFQDLLKALQDDNCNMVELQGLGGTGKTSMAKEVHDKLKESKLIDKSIFLVVSQFPDFKKIRGEVAKSLYLNLDEEKEDELSSTILSRITNMDEKLLIILDDVWVKFDLEDKLGIPYGDQRKGCLPVAIVALARALKNKPISVWKDALKTLEEGGLVRNLEKAYTCLKFSYDNLKSQKAKELLLISSMFREDFEIPIKLLIKIGIGLGSFNENDKYHLIRSEVHETIEELIHSSLLLNDDEECVKMHDLVREVALWIGENDIQSLLDLEKPIKGNLRYMCCMTKKYPDEIDGNKLEYLSIFLDDPGGFNVSDTFFKNMTSIKVLILANDERGPALSLTNSFQPLKSLQMLTLVSLEVGDISVLRNVLTLVTLWFLDCSIVELPKEFSKLKKLRSLDVRSCEIKRNNPFEVIEMCSQLEELTFVGNKCEEEEKDAISHNGPPLTLHRYCISSSEDDDSYYSEENGFSRCFRVDELSNLVSDATCKQLFERAEVLWLEKEDDQRMWNNLVPDIVPIDKEGVMNDLIVLHLSSRPNMKCLIHTKSHHPHVTAFRNLAELHLYEMGIEDLCRGPPPSEFLEQLEILRLRGCYKLKSILFNGNYNLCHLKSIELEDCPMLMSVFQPSTAPCLKKLEELTFKNCGALKYIIAGEDGDSNQNSYYDSLFPSLKELTLSGVPSFIGIVREYHQLSRHNSRNLNQSLSTHAFSWVLGCCSLNKLRPASKETNITISEDRSLDRTKSLELVASKKWIDTAPTIVRQLVLQVRHIRKMGLAGLTLNSVSKLFTLSIASMISWEELEITRFDGLKHLVTSEDDDYKEQISCHSIFPKLKNLEITECKDLEFLFLSSISIEIKNLKSLTIRNAPKLTYVVGKYQHQNQNDELHFDLPALEALSFEDVPEFITIVYSYEGQLNSNTTKKFDASIDRGAHSLPAQSLLLQSLKNVREIKLLECHNIISLSTLSIGTSTIALETLTICGCHKLKCITTHEGDAQVDRNYCAIFPTLEKLEITDCKELEFLFISAISVGLQKLKSLTILRVPELKCVVGNNQKEQHSSNHNQNDELHVDLPALETLYINDAPKINSIFAKNCSMVNWIATEISKAPMLKYIFGISQHDDSLNPDNQNIQTLINFPALKDLSIGATGNKDCDKLKYLFSITISDILPELFSLEIKNAFELEHVLIKRDEMEEMFRKDVLPRRCRFQLINLPNLVNVCHGINFQEEDYYNVSNCPNFDTSTTYQADLEIGNSQVEEKVEEKLSSHMGEEIMTQQSLTVVEARAKGVSSNTLCQISLTSEKEVPTHTSLSLTELPTRDNTHACAKIFEEEEEEQGCLNTSRRLRSGIKASSSLSEDKLETSIDALVDLNILSYDPFHYFLCIVDFVILISIVKIHNQEVQCQPHILLLFHKMNTRDDIQLPIKSQSLAIDSSGSGNLVPNITHPINSLEGVNNEGINEASVVQNESKTNMTCHGDQENPSNITQIEQETSHSRGHMVESRDRTASDFIEDTKLSVSPFYTPIEMMPSFLETNNEASIVHGDAYLFGFDKDWIESIKTKVFDSGICEVDSIQKVLKGLDNDLKSNEAMLESIRDEEVEAARVVEVAQQEHVNVMARHAHLLKERQSIIARRHQCWEIIAARNRHFGF
ncbi:hypothetical protein K1719_029957 [Acacia pycnantha]|nr:hypothetical protein K1719_029957 [Acacia pycnantha]